MPFQQRGYTGVMKNPFSLLLKTFTDVHFYKTLIHTPLKDSLVFFVLCMIFLGLIRTSIFVTSTLPQEEKNIHQSIDILEREYPENLVIVWDTRKLTFQERSPGSDTFIILDQYLFQYPTVLTENQENIAGLPKNFGQYLQNDDLSEVEKTALYQDNFFLLTETDLLLSSSKGEWTAFPLKELPSAENQFQISKSNIPQILNMVKEEISGTFSFIKEMSWVVIPVLLLLFRAASLAILSLFAYFLARLNTLSLTYKKCYQISLHLGVVAECISIVIQQLYPKQNLNWFSMSFWVLFFYVLFTLRKEFSAQTESL